jgi:hypothetical protein
MANNAGLTTFVDAEVCRADITMEDVGFMNHL